MGADMIGYMFRGPPTLDTFAVDAATKEAAERIKALNDCRTLLDELWERESDQPPVQGIVDEGEIRAKIAALLKGPLNCYTTQETPEAAEVVLEEWGNLLELDATEVVKEFQAFWEDGGGTRDAVCRLFREKDGTFTRVVFAGEMSWGDEPSGYGYQIMNKVERLNITRTLGLD